MSLHSVDLALTRRCNLRCAFCYIEDKTSETPADEVQRNLKTLDWVVAQYRAGMDEIPPEHRRIGLNLYGGEPTVAWESVLAMNEYKQTCNIPIQLSLVTNMVLMDEARIDFCIANRIGIHPSIDGCREAEDHFRRTEKGVPVSDIVFRNARVLTGKLKGRSCRSTIAPETAQWMLKSLQFLCEEIGFETVNQVLAGGVTWTEEALEVVRQQTVEITDWWIDCMRKGVHYSLYYMRNMLTGIWAPMRDRSLCSSGLSRGAIDTDGNIYPCHRFCNASTAVEYKMGNIHEGGVVNLELENKLKGFDAALFHKDKCATCIAVNSCHALCLHEMMLQGKGMFEPLEHYCKLWPFYYREAMRAHAILVAERNEKYLQVYRPRPPARNWQRGRRNGNQGAQNSEAAWEGFGVNSVTAAQWVPDCGPPPRPSSAPLGAQGGAT